MSRNFSFYTHLITRSSNIISSENLGEKGRFPQQKETFWNFLYIQQNVTPLEHYPILTSLLYK